MESVTSATKATGLSDAPSSFPFCHLQELFIHKRYWYIYILQKDAKIIQF